MPFSREAEKMFWRTPELVDRLMTFLDSHSTLALVKALPLALDIVAGQSSWIKLVRRVCPHDEPGYVSDNWVAEFVEDRKDMMSSAKTFPLLTERMCTWRQEGTRPMQSLGLS